MGRHHRYGSVRKNVKRVTFPRIYVDRESDYASIKLLPGVEARSYVKEGFAFCEDKKGRIIEVQILNLSQLKKESTASAA